MAKTLKQILDGIKSSKLKTKDILGNQPGVDYSPKAKDERDFADQHHIQKHADRVGNGDDIYQATNIKQDTTARHGHKSRNDEKVYEAAKRNMTEADLGLECNMSEAGVKCPVHGMMQCPAKVLNEKPVKEVEKHKAGRELALKKKSGDKNFGMAEPRVKATEEVEQIDEILVHNYISGPKNKSAQVRKNMNAGNYSVKKITDDTVVGISNHDDATSAHAAAKKHIDESEIDKWSKHMLRPLGSIAKSKQTMLVTMKKDRVKNTKTGGGVTRIKKSEYDPKIHDLAEEEVINELSADKLNSYASSARKQHDRLKRVKIADDPEASDIKNRMMQNRAKGVNRASKKLDNPVKLLQYRTLSQESSELGERKMSDAEMEKRERIVKGMKKKLSDFRARYGKRAKDVMYAAATKQAMKEDPAQSAAPENLTKNEKKKKMEQSAPAVTPITLPNFSADVNTGRNV